MSDVVTTVLIILFAIVAVAVVGGIVLNQVNKAGKTIDKASICTENTIDVASCVWTDSADADTNRDQVKVGYTRTGGGSLTMNSGQAQIKLTDGSLPTGQTVTAITQGQSGTVTFASVATQPDEAYVTVVYQVGAETQTCKSTVIKCTNA